MEDSENFLKVMHRIKIMIFDVDGVLTDGSVTLFPNGEQVRKMITRDGFAINHAIKQGMKICIISGGKSEAVKIRMEGLGVELVYLGVEDKIDTYKEVLSIYNLTDQHVLYMGDDLPDYEVMKLVALPCCPDDAAREIKAISTFISTEKGGMGCVRDVIEKTLQVQNKWNFSQ